MISTKKPFHPLGENNPEDHVRYARMDLMGMVREDLAFDMARHVVLDLNTW
jgi:hypothetical protein